MKEAGGTVRIDGKITGWVQRWLPRLLALVWAAWAAVTAVAYIDMVPQQLAAVDGAISAPVWLLWAIAATLLVAGVLVPSCAPDAAHTIARWSRITGMTIITAELVVWTAAFFVDEPRGWVSGKNYAMLLGMALFCTWTIARDKARGKAVNARGD